MEVRAVERLFPQAEYFTVYCFRGFSLADYKLGVTGPREGGGGFGLSIPPTPFGPGGASHSSATRGYPGFMFMYTRCVFFFLEVTPAADALFTLCGLFLFP
ncbi:hypothetical protein TcCL_NonESM08743 [Trypanosoma cruzi]|nr:hypothetical protein TcCL_NonESM08743 [Trypanosoma cruzi]